MCKSDLARLLASQVVVLQVELTGVSRNFSFDDCPADLASDPAKDQPSEDSSQVRQVTAVNTDGSTYKPSRCLAGEPDLC